MLSNCFMYKVVLLFAKFTKLVFSLTVKNDQGYIVHSVLQNKFPKIISTGKQVHIR